MNDMRFPIPMKFHNNPHGLAVLIRTLSPPHMPAVIERKWEAAGEGTGCAYALNDWSRILTTSKGEIMITPVEDTVRLVGTWLTRQPAEHSPSRNKMVPALSGNETLCHFRCRWTCFGLRVRQHGERGVVTAED
jgi:hypothetical protein